MTFDGKWPFSGLENVVFDVFLRMFYVPGSYFQLYLSIFYGSPHFIYVDGYKYAFKKRTNLFCLAGLTFPFTFVIVERSTMTELKLIRRMPEDILDWMVGEQRKS